MSLGFNVRCHIRKGRENHGWLESLPVEFVEADVFDVPSLDPLLDGVEYVFHIGGVTKAKRREDYFRGNVVATKNLLQASLTHSSIKKFCYLSSLTAVGPSKDGNPLDETAPCRPITTYGVSKLQAEKAVASYSSRIPTLILRPPAVYGPRDKDILELYRAVRFGIQPVIGSKRKTLSLIHVSDLTRGIVEAAVSEKTDGKIYFVTDENIHHYQELFKILEEIMGKRTISVPIPGFLLFSLASITEVVSTLAPRPAVLSIDKARDLLQTHWVCSGKKLTAETGFKTSIAIREGLAETYRWYESKGWLKLGTIFGR